ncbi:NUDIX domain-containing protein [Blastomonas sp. UPD001]|jgi:8-oxo-dGTP pyrophosphatase MutT (NUDIX family)|uniref:NUDIX domain-containing protein n=1 Tax=Blastomonas sp. UPD001 TaxID=2217673 RepID=UPI000E3535C3|nr:NUDIX domain-containing protein [Blastomonas sp. UPD001]MBL0965775.1 NUDIX domain-containing protein [Blastomonas sp.]
MTPLRLAYIVAHRVRLILRRLFQIRTQGVKAVVLRGREVLLIRHSYYATDRYMLPGGGVGRGETSVEAGIREVLEETGCRLESPRMHGEFLSHHEGFPDQITIVVGETRDDPRADPGELLEARFFPLDALPDALADASRRRIIEVRDGLPPSDRW